MAKLRASLPLLFLTLNAFPFFTLAKRRDLTEITYRLTNCESASHDGPRVNSRCVPLYEEMSSPIANNGTLFEFENGLYSGAQGFRLPRDGLYNITVAGASGGEGVCNFHYGLGGVISAQVRLTTHYEYLIMVGHRGTSVCEVPENTNHSICQPPRPTNLDEAQICQNNWLNWTAMFDNSQDRYNFNGGGGGGGASMIWPRRADNKEFTDLPIAISPGGGGAAAILDYEFVAEVIALSQLNLSISGNNESIYSFHTNGHITRYALNWPEGVRGFRASDLNISSGAGEGWGTLQGADFAEGGSDCSTSLKLNSSIFTNVFGGYGGGGGGCGSGGGGGGYTGGHVLASSNKVPGGGGDAVFNLTELPLLSMSTQYRYNDGDGYVEIVASNCGCDGECVVYTEERQFECQCPSNTLLAEDESSCYREINITVFPRELPSFSDDGEIFYYMGLQFADASYHIFGLDVSLTVSPSPGSGLSPEEVACAVVFLSLDLKTVLSSNPVRIRGTNGTRAYQLSILGQTGTGVSGFGPATDYVSFLSSPILVTGAYLISNGECSLTSPFRANISSEDAIPPFDNFDAFYGFDSSALVPIARNILQVQKHMPTTIAPGVIVGVVIGSILLLITLIIIIIVGVVLFNLWNQRSRSPRKIPRKEKVNFETPAIRISKSSSSWTLSNEDRESYETVFSSVQVSYQLVTLGNEIGQGAFGMVYEGKIQRQAHGTFENIAIKTTKNLNSPNELKAFLEESLLMMDFNHPNVLNLVGVCFDTPDEVPFILLPFMTNGSLKDYLMKKRTNGVDVSTLPEDLTVSVLIRMCIDIASGMEYLAGEKFVHRDLAARNCMVDAMLQIKIGDFGLARDVYTDDYHISSEETKLPVKWMAVEALLDRISNEKTDVWSFGVTCWEVFSLGRTPYPHVPNCDVLDYIATQNYRLENPFLCPRKMYDLAMSQCWQLLPEERPTFSQLVCQLKEYWEEEHAYEHSYVQPCT